MDSGDDRSSTAGVGPDWPLIPGPASALFDILSFSASIAGHHHIGIVAPAPGTDEPLLPIGNGRLGAISSRHFGWRSHLRWLRQELRSGIGLRLIAAFEAPDDEPNTGNRRPRVSSVGRVRISSSRACGIVRHAAAHIVGWEVRAPVWAQGAACGVYLSGSQYEMRTGNGRPL
jgi:hypothetical protein